MLDSNFVSGRRSFLSHSLCRLVSNLSLSSGRLVLIRIGSTDDSNEKYTPSAECPEDGPLPNPRDEDIKRVIKIIEKEKKDVGGNTTIREHIMSKVLLSALGLVCGAFGLFCAGIVMLAWNKQPRSVAIFTSAIIVCCISLLPMLFLEHRHKHVISKLNLRRPTF